jgi:signal peptidase I
MRDVVRRLNRFLGENRGLIAFLLLFGLIRTAVADYNPVPSGSMHPNILEGDVVLVNRLAYDIKVPLTDIVIARTGDPQRGDIVTFSSPRDGLRLIKRVIGLPGDCIAMRDKHLWVNGRAVEYLPAGMARESTPGGATMHALRLREVLGPHRYEIQWLANVNGAADFGPVTIPRDEYLMLGDNRDNSADSRYIGLVPRRLLIGRAERVLLSVDIDDDWVPRFERFGRSFYP